jgi:hypothetical protein
MQKLKKKPKKKKSSKSKIMAAMLVGQDKKPDLTEFKAQQIAAKATRGKSLTHRRFLRDLQAVAEKHGYSTDMVDKSDGLEIEAVFTYSGKVEIMLPELSKITL